VDRGDFPERATLRLDAYRLKRAADGDGDWCAHEPCACLRCAAHALCVVTRTHARWSRAQCAALTRAALTHPHFRKSVRASSVRWVIVVAATVMRPGDDEVDDQPPDDSAPVRMTGARGARAA
jgi:hypothetical protein